MKCPECKLIEMLVKEIKRDMITFICPKCKKETETSIKEIKTSE